MVQDKSLFSRLFDICNYTFLWLLALVTVIPFINIFASSFASAEELMTAKVLMFPKNPTLLAYKYIFSTPTLTRSFGVTIYITIMGTGISIFLTSILAFSLAHTEVIGRKVIMILITFTMLFNGGMIPTFILIKNLGMMDSLWALMIPPAISAFNLIVLKNFFQQMPKELEESAMIDGASDLRIYFSIILPLATPALSTIALFYAVNYWNTFMPALLYLNDPKKWPLQVLLRQIVLLLDINMLDGGEHGDANAYLPPVSVKYATITVVTVPILLVYPFLQKYFTKGLMLGSIKG